MFLIAIAKIIPLEPIMSREDILCPLDIIPFNCSIDSNSEVIHLMWRVLIPGEFQINITYSDVTDELTNLSSYITTVLTDFKSDEYIFSTLEISVFSGIPTDKIMLECSIGNLANDSTTVFINTSSKLQIRTPRRDNYSTNMFITIKLLFGVFFSSSDS